MAEMTIKKRPKNLDLTTIQLPLPGKSAAVVLAVSIPLTLVLWGVLL
jgi:succinate dehydrogenase / fumarate reductase cytochrome b subunit